MKPNRFLKDWVGGFIPLSKIDSPLVLKSLSDGAILRIKMSKVGAVQLQSFYVQSFLHIPIQGLLSACFKYI